MTYVESNFDAVVQLMSAFGNAIDFTAPRPGGGGSLGDALGDVVAEHTRERALGTQTGPDGTHWDELNPLYERRKGFSQIGVGAIGGGETGDAMLSMEQLKGERDISSDQMSITYGVSEWARTKALWFQDGTSGPGSRVQPARPFWGLDDAMETALAEVIVAYLDFYLDAINRQLVA